MKKFTAVLAVLMCLTAFSGCKDTVTITEGSKMSDQSAEDTTSTDEKSDSDDGKNTSEDDSQEESDESDNENKENNENNESSNSESYEDSESDVDSENNEEAEYDWSELENTASEQYEKSCEMQWKYIVNCPFELDYDDMIGNGYRVKDIDSLNDILWDYNTVFTSCITENGETSRGDRSAETLQQKYIPAESGLYCIDGGRGKNKSYKSTEFEFISYENNILRLTAISYYEDSNGETTAKENPFTIVNVDGEWKTYDFTLPY